MRCSRPAVTFATALPRMDHPNRLMDVDQNAAAVVAAAVGSPRASAAESRGPFKVRTARIAIDFFDELEQPLVAGRGFDSRDLGEGARTGLAHTLGGPGAVACVAVLGQP